MQFLVEILQIMRIHFQSTSSVESSNLNIETETGIVKCSNVRMCKKCQELKKVKTKFTKVNIGSLWFRNNGKPNRCGGFLSNEKVDHILRFGLF